MELCQHREDHLDDEDEVGYAKPGYLAIAHRHGDVLGGRIKLLLVLLLLLVILIITFSLILQVFFVPFI